ncbi:MAG: glutamine-hydrolyzing carbamoyl-phosphate synthase small subunit [Euryarchaeota archaeon]|nr:glutamine-hydrolyzing carbamoyl-phosphate synthase small subunit [Euryarchaeota archaeon]
MKATLALEDGTIVKGTGFGAEKESLGEVVFNTSMCGYVESLTDPSYNGQILMSTYPLIGNYKVDEDWFESHRIWVEGFIVREVCEKPSHWKAVKILDEFLREYGIPGMQGVDTRALTIKIRKYGVMKGALLTYTGADPDFNELLEKARRQPSTSEIDLVAEATRDKITRFDAKGEFEVVLIDCGVKLNIVRSLLKRGISVIAVPAKTPASEIKAFNPDGIVISNGPGDPAVITYVHETVKKLLPNYPIIGICLGHQILALASGAKTYKLKFGHRGVNVPVGDIVTEKVYITTQNHGFAVNASSLDRTDFKIKYKNLNDNSVEGMTHKELPIISVQWHPEHSPGPQDTNFLFDDFLEVVKEYQ